MNPLFKLQIIIAAVTDSFNKGVERTKQELDALRQRVKTLASEFVLFTRRSIEFANSFNASIKNNIELVAEFAKELGGVKGGLLGILALKNASFGDLLGQFSINAGVLGVQINQAKQFETAFADAKKVIGGTDDELLSIEQTIKRLAITEIPLPITGIVDIAKAGGQLGIPSQAIKDYIELASQAAVAFDMLPDESGQAIGTLTNVFAAPLADIRRLIDEINVLGDTTAATERDILEVLRYVGGTGKTFGLDKGEIAALTATLLSLGKAPEVTRTALTSLLTTLQTGASRGKDFQATLAALGLTSEQLALSIKQNPQQALFDFLALLNQADDKASVLYGLFGSGTDASAIDELASSLTTLKANVNKVNDDAQVAGSALKTFEARANTLENHLLKAANAVGVLSVNIGNPFLAPVKTATSTFTGFVTALAQFAEDHPAIASFIKIISLVAPLGLLLNSLRAIGTAATSAAGIALFSRALALARTGVGAFVLSTGGAVAAIAVLSTAFSGINSLLAATVIALGLVGINAVKAFRVGGVTAFQAALIGVRNTLGYLGAAFAGGGLGILLTVIAGLIVAYTNLKDVIVKVGDTTASVSDFITAVWRVATGDIVDSVSKLINRLTDLIDALTETGTQSDAAAKKSAQSWNLNEQTTVNAVKSIVNTLKGLSDLIGNYTTIQFDRYTAIIRTRLTTLVELAKASKKDLQAALLLDFSFNASQQALAQGNQQIDAINQQSDQRLKQAVVGSLTTDYVQNEIHNAQSQQYTTAFNQRLDALNQQEQQKTDADITHALETITGKTSKIATDIEKLYQAANAKYQLPDNLVKAIATVESGGKQEAVSNKGAVGVMQVVPAMHPEFNPGQLRINQAYNIDAGAQYLAELNQLFHGDLVSVIAAYNTGQGNVQRHGLQGVLQPGYAEGETLAYVEKVLAELDKLQKTPADSNLVERFKAAQALITSQREAITVTNESTIENRVKDIERSATNEIEQLKQLKEQGKIGISEFYSELTTQQETIVKANIEAVTAKSTELARQFSDTKAATKPEDLPKVTAEFNAKKVELDNELADLQQKLTNIKPANLIDAEREQKQLDQVVAQVNARLAELRGETVDDPIAIKARIEIENADVLKQLRQVGQSGLAERYVTGLAASAQAGVLEGDISRVQQRTQSEETRVNVLQQSHSITQFEAQQQLKTLYEESANELDKMADKLTSLGENSGLDEIKLKALNAKNAAAQLRATLPSVSEQIIDTAQSSAIQSMTDNLDALTSGAKSAEQAFTDFGLSVAQSIQHIANQKLAEQIFGQISSLIGSAYGSYGGGTNAGINTSNTGVNSSISSYLSSGISSAYAEGGLITGPGTGTSDSIPMQLPVGSFVIKADSVKKVGVPKLTQLMQQASAQEPAKNTVSALVSNGEFIVPAPSVNKYGVKFYQHINKHGLVPPASIQKAYARGGFVGVQSSSVESQTINSDSMTVNVPVTINQTKTDQANTANKTNQADQLNELGKRIKLVVQDELVQQSRPGGLLYNLQNGRA